MKINVMAQVWIKEEIEVDDKFFELQDGSPSYEECEGEEASRLEDLSDECIDICRKTLEKKYGDSMELDTLWLR